jgi:GxxExxY protein
LRKKGHEVFVEHPIPVMYDGVQLEIGYVADLVVEGKVIVELKSVEQVAPVHLKQLLTYLRLADKKVGLLLNFNVPLIKSGIHRVVNGSPEDKPNSPKRKLLQP